jgi:transcriptional regulator with XRE-family HTH domain
MPVRSAVSIRGVTVASPGSKAVDHRIAAIREALGLRNITEVGRLFGVSRQAIEQWLRRDVIPVEHRADVDRMAEVAGELSKRFKTDRLPAIISTELPILDNRSISETLQTDGPLAIFELFHRWSAYIPGSEPIRAGEFGRGNA